MTRLADGIDVEGPVRAELFVVTLGNVEATREQVLALAVPANAAPEAQRADA